MKVDGRELRIGNWVSYRGEKECLVSNLGNSFEAVKMINVTFQPYGSDDINEFQPIPLTEEWLLRFGFEAKTTNYKSINVDHFQNNDCWIYLLDGCFELELNTLNERHNLARQYKYVHQLQNLYFALTGEELTLK